MAARFLDAGARFGFECLTRCEPRPVFPPSGRPAIGSLSKTLPSALGTSERVGPRARSLRDLDIADD
jgi:hypothetical protein